MALIEEDRIKHKKQQPNYIPLADYFMLWLLTFGRTFTRGSTFDGNATLEDTGVYSWNSELIPWGYIEEIKIDDDDVELRLTDKAMALIKERANDD